MNLLKSRNKLAPGSDVDLELYEGDIKLAVKSSADYKATNQFKKCLTTIESLRIDMNRWSENEGIVIMVSAQKPLPLVDILNQMSIVERIYEERDNITVILNAAEISVEQ